jgi:hypothetical protein
MKLFLKTLLLSIFATSFVQAAEEKGESQKARHLSTIPVATSEKVQKLIFRKRTLFAIADMNKDAAEALFGLACIDGGVSTSPHLLLQAYSLSRIIKGNNSNAELAKIYLFHLKNRISCITHGAEVSRFEQDVFKAVNYKEEEKEIPEKKMKKLLGVFENGDKSALTKLAHNTGALEAFSYNHHDKKSAQSAFYALDYMATVMYNGRAFFSLCSLGIAGHSDAILTLSNLFKKHPYYKKLQKCLVDMCGMEEKAIADRWNVKSFQYNQPSAIIDFAHKECQRKDLDCFQGTRITIAKRLFELASKIDKDSFALEKAETEVIACLIMNEPEYAKILLSAYEDSWYHQFLISAYDTYFNLIEANRTAPQIKYAHSQVHSLVAAAY